ncbi:thiamine-phosphate kinase [Sphingorhabdus sp. IMCC26285]|uniref:Thiamine-monophosphate kinase n=1 Tax=Sphingorhabdus profundilacus TaxID=2509718 RepID=A0A6I4LYN2_9SPHN|nr:thiamine-phosphate kinase [Sphingorhabdus profundilacus]MVZ97080.1 thiamine-phosphate kinase [Sphingorhabdus profundilacus]
MTSESTFIGLMRAMATDPAARDLLDDCAVISLGSENLILTHDMMAEDVHWLPSADPADVAWKLVASNLSDLAAKGARPLGVLLGFMLGEDSWDRAFAVGLHKALSHFGVALLGGDTVANRGDKRALGLTAIGAATCAPVPSRGGAMPGDLVYVTGTLGDALAGFELIEAGFDEVGPLATAYNRPEPRLAEGQLLAPLVHAMMDVSDGLLLDAERLANASKMGIAIDLSKIPLSPAYINYRGDALESRLQAASWGDDYQLLFAISPEIQIPVAAQAIGCVTQGAGLILFDGDKALPRPATLGYQHQ